MAKDAGKPFMVLTKTRHGDRDVEVSVPDVERWREKTPVLVDDIISTGRTMAETLDHLARRQDEAGHLHRRSCRVRAAAPMTTCRRAGAGRIVTTNTIAHASNGIDVSALLAEGVRSVWDRSERPDETCRDRRPIPIRDSFTLSVARTYCEAAQAKGHEPLLRDLYAMDFDPRLKASEIAGHAGLRAGATMWRPNAQRWRMWMCSSSSIRSGSMRRRRS